MKILIICTGNSCRSQMAEGILRNLDPSLEIYSAGTYPARFVSPYAVDVMKEIGIDISGNRTKSVFEMYKQGKLFNYVFTVCDESKAEACPAFPGTTKNIHLGFTDPSSFTGSHDEKLAGTRKVRDEIKNKIEEWVRELK